MVFQTAPPQPASKARCTCIPVLLGGAEASQNGLGDWIPAKLIFRSAIRHQPFMKRPRRQLSSLHSRHGRGRATSPNAVPAGINPRQAGFEIGVDVDKSLVSLELYQWGQRGLLLPNCLHNLVGGKQELRTGHRLW